MASKSPQFQNDFYQKGDEELVVDQAKQTFHMRHSLALCTPIIENSTVITITTKLYLPILHL